MEFVKTAQLLQAALDKVFKTQTSYYKAAELCDLGVIALPAPLGSNVYQILWDDKQIATYTLIGVHITNGYSTGKRRNARDYMIVLHKPTNKVEHLNMCDLGITVFADDEEARRNLYESQLAME